MDALRTMADPFFKRDSKTDQLLLLLQNPFSEQLSQSSVVAGFGTSLGFTLLLAVGFSLLRPYNSLVYAPKLKVADDKHAPPPMGKGIFAWMGPVMKTKEEELVELIGMDATVFLRILRMCRNMFLVLAVLACGILIPVNLTRGNTALYSLTTPSLSKLTPQYTFGSDQWGMVICAWLFDIVVAGFLWWNYKAILRLRRRYYASPEYKASLHARTLMLNDIPKNLRSDEGIGRLIDEVVPTSSFSRTAIARNVKELPELIQQHNDTVRELERYLARPEASEKNYQQPLGYFTYDSLGCAERWDIYLLVSLPNLGRVWTGFDESLQAHKTWWSIVQGVASPAITSLIYLVLPITFRRLAIKAGDRTKTARERHVAAKLYTFFVFNFLIVFSIFSTTWTFVSGVIQATNNKEDAWKAIQKAQYGTTLFVSLCGISPFWITWLLQRNLGAAVDLAQLWTLVWSFCMRKFSSPTPREMIELTAPPAFDYASYYNYFLFYSTVALCYGTLQPLAVAAAALYFALDVYLKKYLLLYIFITKTESGGMFWRMFYNRIVFATILANLVVCLSVFVQGDGQHYQAYSVIPLPFLMIGFKWYCKITFDDKIHYVTSNNMKDVEALNTKNFSDKRDRLSSRFGHPALYRALVTPMVHAKAQNKLAGIYAGRLTDSNTPGSGESASVSGYSDTYALESMEGGQPGRKAKGIEGFEMVPENKLDFAYYKGRAEFSDEHGGHGVMYGKAEDIVRSDTPGSMSAFTDSRPGTPVGGMTGRRNFTPHTMGGVSYDAQGDMGAAIPQVNNFYRQRNDSETGLVHGAADMPLATPGLHPYNPRETSQERRAPGFLGGGPQGYGNLPQHPVDEVPEQYPMSYDYFRTRRQNGPYQQ
ncbi:hypothetical protein G7Y89_g8830 [Cudoniella acicularis]|uniref:Uncharacterized protein n=1 Tax=Cudoniella acicularis TaxID=354080 RepID=A0A8H4RIG9_9HELO|nr:hypothetical protein G7Y89_g8830 [Cudoniella acicularis]